MIELTLGEKRTIFQILVLVMQADMVERPEEASFLDGVFHDFDLSIEEFDHLEGLDLDYLKQEYIRFSPETKDFARKLFMDMAKCDGYFDFREGWLIDTIDS